MNNTVQRCAEFYISEDESARLIAIIQAKKYDNDNKELFINTVIDELNCIEWLITGYRFITKFKFGNHALHMFYKNFSWDKNVESVFGVTIFGIYTNKVNDKHITIHVDEIQSSDEITNFYYKHDVGFIQFSELIRLMILSDIGLSNYDYNKLLI